MKLKNSLSRRDFIKLAGSAFGLGALACGGGNKLLELTPVPRVPETITLSPKLAFYITLSGMKLSEEPNAKKNFLFELQRLLDNPDQADDILATMIGNRMSYDQGNIPLPQDFADGNVFAYYICSDARGLARAKVPGLYFSDSTARFLLDNRQAGVIPSKVPSGVKKSLFFSHQVIPFCEGGTTCGYLGGVELALKLGDEEAKIALQHHGVPPETIANILEWKRTYGKDIDFVGDFGGKTGTDLSEEWARIGGRVQAYINGPDHIVVSGVQVNAEGTLKVLEYADGRGNIYTPIQGRELAPDLAAAADFFDQPHPRLESFLRQTPDTNILNFSNFGSQALFGDGKIIPENVFVVNSRLGQSITREAIDSALNESISSLGYSLGALEQRTKIVYLVTNNPGEMAIARQAFLSSSYAQKFLDSKGILVELVVQPDGLFEKQVVLRTSESPILLTFSSEEQILKSAGINKIHLTGATRIVENANDMLVMVESSVDGEVYEIRLPKGSTHSNITAERLVERGMPALEALWYERAFAAFGKVALVAGVALMLYDGSKFLLDTFGYGESIQMANGDVLLNMSQELRQSMSILGLDRTVVGRGIKGRSFFQAREALTKRAESFNYDGIKTSHLLRIDDPFVGIPFSILNDKDTTLPIRVDTLEMARTGEYPDNQERLVVVKFQYVNTITGEKMVITRDPLTGEYSKEGPDNFFFSVPAIAYNNASGDPTLYDVPVRFSLLKLQPEDGDNGVFEAVVPYQQGIQPITQRPIKQS